MLIASVVLLFLIAINAFYVAAEFAAVSVRHSRIRQKAEEGHWLARRLWPVLNDGRRLDTYIAACQIGITWSSLVLGAYAQAAITPGGALLLQQHAGINELAALSTAALIVLVVTTVLQVVFGELVPKSVALQFPTETALYTVVPMKWSVRLYWPFLKVLNGSGLWILRVLGFTATGHRHIHSPEELEFLIAESRKGGMLDADEHRRLHRAIRLASRPVRQLMVPRSRVVAINVDSSEDELLRVIEGHRFTRYPIYRGSADEIIGMLHTADLVMSFVRNGKMPAVREVMRPLVRIPETDTAERLLAHLREARSSQAAVTSSYGVTGLVTVGDLLAELLGDFERNASLGQPEPEVLQDGRVRLPGLLRLDEAVPWLGVHISSGADTLGGALLHAFGRMPKPGERIRLAGIDVVVEEVSRNMIASVVADPPRSLSEDDRG